LRKMRFRIGINVGDVIAEGERIYGDGVNIAARLEQLNKEFGTYILCGENTTASCEEVCKFKPITEVTVRGRNAPTRVFQPMT